MTTDPRYTLNIGCISQDNRITSRDSEVRQFATEAEAQESIRQSSDFWHSIGYKIWFVKLTDPQGKEIKPCRTF